MGSKSSMRDIDMVSTNKMVYKMTLLEVYIETQAGMSGSPLLDANGMVIGMFHGLFRGTRSYFIASHHSYRWYQRLWERASNRSILLSGSTGRTYIFQEFSPWLKLFLLGGSAWAIRTEQSSSGAPLFNSNGGAIGDLKGD